MLTSRKSLANLVETAEGPYIIHFKYWFEAKFKQGTCLKVYFGKRLPISIQMPLPHDKHVIIDIVSRQQMPICKIESPDGIAQIDLKKYMPGLTKDHSIHAGRIKIVFNLQLLSNTNDISNLYASERISDQQKIRYQQSLNDLIRSEAQFLSKYQKNAQIEQVNKKQQQETELQNKLTVELGSIKSIDLNFKTLITIFILFMMIGYLIASPEPQQRKSTKKKSKKAKY